ncbi:unnamed protein product [Cunninghamella blakesleeana]
MFNIKRATLLNRRILSFKFYTNKACNLIEIKNATVYRSGKKEPVFEHLSFSIQRNQKWVIVGPVNAEISPYPSDHVHLVSFKEESGVFNYSQHYYQERFNFSDPDNDLTLKDYLGKDHPEELINKVAKQLDLVPLLHLSFVKLSNGQTRRARIARALLRHPKMLILDEPLMGLDVQHRKQLLNLLGEIATKDGVSIILISRPQDEFPTWSTNVLVLDQMKIIWQGNPELYIKEHNMKMDQKRKEKEDYRQRLLKKQEEEDMSHSEKRPDIITLNNINVVYSGKKILDNISWNVKRGDRWVLLGPNGSGKTTLLSLLTGDHPQAYANDLSLFGRPRGTGESIWEIKQKIGLVSPEIHLYFNQQLTGLTAAGTGFFDVVVPRVLNDIQKKTIERLFTEFNIQSCLNRTLKEMSSGEQRMVLLVRSLVKQPPLIIWDEPFQGLDVNMITKVTDWLENYMKKDQTFILVTHHEDEIPRVVTKRFHLGPGGVDANK